MARCIELAKLSRSEVCTNPNVGAVLVYKDKIIGEGRHEIFGGPHAEVNAINNVKNKDKHLIPYSTLYVSLEPCNFKGKTLPCSALIKEQSIKKLVIGCKDPNPRISGSSLANLRQNGVNIIDGILEKECQRLINHFRINILKQRPEITIKFAQSKDNYISKLEQQTWLTNDYSKILSHKLRAESNGILVGTNTAEIDNPSLNVREYLGSSPLRIIIDKDLRVNQSHKIYHDGFESLIISQENVIDHRKHIDFWTMGFNEDLLEKLMNRLYRQKHIGRLVVEGGAQTIQSFLDKNLWDKAVILTSPNMLHEGIKAPTIEGLLSDAYKLDEDSITVINNPLSE
jgi:diaminohydroxyphosphoribosylaminopyrimidine deaminase/5-amino-6-(5-phosphoribosylamino)uracil reductase